MSVRIIFVCEVCGLPGNEVLPPIAAAAPAVHVPARHRCPNGHEWSEALFVANVGAAAAGGNGGLNLYSWRVLA